MLKKTNNHLEQLNNLREIGFQQKTILFNINKLIMQPDNIELMLSKKQIKLITCLSSNIITKAEIINFIWHPENTHEKENHYNQLVYQTRARLANKGFPDDTIITLPRYGLCLNKNYFLTDVQPDTTSIHMLDKSAYCHHSLFTFY